MSDMYPSTFPGEEIQRPAEQKILKHGDNAFAEAEKEISASTGIIPSKVDLGSIVL